MLDVKNLSRSYGDFVAVDDVSFEIGGGEIVGLLGHNGAGKTTIMKMLSGFLEADSGRVSIGGVDISADLKQMQRDLGYLPENLPLYPELTVADYLDYAADLKRLAKSDKRREIRRVIEETDLTIKLNDEISTLSRGYKQRVGVAQAILGSPKLLILDEPTNGLDPTQTDQMRQLLRTIASNATVILSTHIMQEVEALCDRVLMMRSGQMVVDEKLANLQQSNHLLVETSMPLREIQSVVTSVPGVVKVNSIPNVPQQFLLSLTDDTVRQQASAAVVQAIVAAGSELYSLQTQRRDLQALFREVNSPASSSVKEVSHAA